MFAFILFSIFMLIGCTTDVITPDKDLVERYTMYNWTDPKLSPPLDNYRSYELRIDTGEKIHVVYITGRGAPIRYKNIIWDRQIKTYGLIYIILYRLN